MKDKCKNCTQPSKACISYLMTLTTKEMLEWCLMWKKRLGWSNAYLAEKTRVPKGTIDRIMSHAKTNDETAGVKLATVRPIICAITGCTMQELETCEVTQEADIAALIEERNKLKEEVALLHAESETRLSFISHQMHLKDRYIGILAILLGLCCTLIFFALLIDKINPNLGFFWIK